MKKSQLRWQMDRGDEEVYAVEGDDAVRRVAPLMVKRGGERLIPLFGGDRKDD